MAVVEAIQTVYLEADATSVTFSSIPSTYEHLQLRLTARSDYAGGTYDTIAVRLNGDSGSNYARHYMYGQQTTAGAGGDASIAQMRLGTMENDRVSDSANYGTTLADVLDYANASKATTVRAVQGVLAGGYASAAFPVQFLSGLWTSTAAVSTILLYPWNGSNFLRGSEFSLYGIASS